MWSQAIKSLNDDASSLESRILSGGIRFRGSAWGVQKNVAAVVDAAFSIRARKLSQPPRLVVANPRAMAEEARHVLVGLALSQLVEHSNSLTHEDYGGLLFVTQQITSAREELSRVLIRSQSLDSVFDIRSLADFHGKTSWNTILVANPGRALQRLQHLPNLRAVIVDATHPRTLNYLKEFLDLSQIQDAALFVLVAPPHDELLRMADSFLWLWDPSALAATADVLDRRIGIYHPHSRQYWIAQDKELDACLQKAESLLVQASKVVQTGLPRMVLDAWSVTSALRSLTVPLDEAERAWRQSRRATRVRDRIAALTPDHADMPAAVRAFFDVHWHETVSSIRAAYEILATRSVPEKFFAVVRALESAIEGGKERVRIVTASKDEAPLLLARLGDYKTEFRRLLADGNLEVVHSREEGYRVAGGRLVHTILSSPRGTRSRYLDIFPVFETHVGCYPSEATRDVARLEKSYARWKRTADESNRNRCMALLGIRNHGVSSERPAWRIPPTKLHGTIPRQALVEPEFADASLLIDWLPESGATLASSPVGGDSNSSLVRLQNADGDILEYRANQLLTVFRPETELIQRVAAANIRPGDLLVVLSDDHYGTLFDRLLDAMSTRRPLVETLLLERWYAAKQRLLQVHRGSRRVLYRQLQANVAVDYPAVRSWFSQEADEGEIIAPRDYTDFEQLARATGIYTDDGDIRSTFNAVRAERSNRRRLGRMLRQRLRKLVDGRGFDAALSTSLALDAEVEEVLHAVELHEIKVAAIQDSSLKIR